MYLNRISLVTTCLLAHAAFSAPEAAGASITVQAFNNATVQPGGPRTGSNGKGFFNMEGSGNGTFASYGVLDFQIPMGSPSLQISSLTVSLTQENASFTHNGALSFFLSTDTSTNIDPGTSPLRFPNPVPTLSFSLGSGVFTEVADDHTDSYTFALAGQAQTYVDSQLTNAGLVRIVIEPNDPNVAATYAGASFSTAAARPVLTLATTVATPEPSTLGLLAAGLAFMLGFSSIRRRSRCI
jgi:hypothetical protein